MKKRGQEIDNFEGLIEKIKDAKAKAALQLYSSISETD